VIVVKRHLVNFSAISWHTSNVRWYYDDVRFVLDQNMASWIFIMLTHWNNSRR